VLTTIGDHCFAITELCERTFYGIGLGMTIPLRDRDTAVTSYSCEREGIATGIR
jgi:hypothetical protein